MDPYQRRIGEKQGLFIETFFYIRVFSSFHVTSIASYLHCAKYITCSMCYHWEGKAYIQCLRFLTHLNDNREVNTFLSKWIVEMEVGPVQEKYKIQLCDDMVGFSELQKNFALMQCRIIWYKSDEKKKKYIYI